MSLLCQLMVEYLNDEPIFIPEHKVLHCNLLPHGMIYVAYDNVELIWSWDGVSSG